jgi:drug/metabolite transporter (DMT)-like permease
LRKDYRRGIFQLLIGAAMISFSPVFVRIADVGPTMAGVYRSLIGGAFLLILVVARGEPLWRGKLPFGLALICAPFFSADLSFWHRSISYIGPGLSTIMGNFQVFFLAAFGIIVFKERVEWRFVAAVPIAIVGLFLLVGFEWNELDSSYRLGVFFGLTTAITYAVYVLVLQKSQTLDRRLSATANLAVISLITGGFMAIEARFQGESFYIPNAKSWVSMLAYGIICQALGWIIISRALTRVPASRAGLVLLLQPMLAFVWDVLFFERPTDFFDVGGAVLALFAIYLGTFRKRSPPKRP